MNYFGTVNLNGGTITGNSSDNGGGINNNNNGTVNRIIDGSSTPPAVKAIIRDDEDDRKFWTDYIYDNKDEAGNMALNDQWSEGEL